MFSVSDKNVAYTDMGYQSNGRMWTLKSNFPYSRIRIP